MTARRTDLLDHLHRLAAAPAADPADDSALLDRFVRLRDGAAFAALVARHGGMVRGVCRRILGDAHSADDAFQAAFLVLSQRAGAIRRRESLAAWLHAVAYRVARRARASADGRKRRESLGPAPEPAAPHADPLEQLTVRELLAALEEEVQRLPEAYRLPVVLCCLEGLSQEEAARRLRLTPAAVRARLERGRKRLHAQLARRGLALAAALGVAEVARGFAASVPAALTRATARAALLTTAGDAAAAGAVPASVASLTKGVLRAMFLKKLRTVTAVMLGLALAGFGVGALTYSSAPARAEEPPLILPAPSAPQPAAEKGHANNSLPDGPMPIPALLHLDKQGRVVLQMKVRVFQQVTLPGAGGGPGPTVIEPAYVSQNSYLKLGDVQAFDTHGKKVERKALARLLKKEVLALVYHAGQKVDPLHLRLLKEGTLVFRVPLPAAQPYPGGLMPVPVAPGGVQPPPAASGPGVPVLPPSQPATDGSGPGSGPLVPPGVGPAPVPGAPAPLPVASPGALTVPPPAVGGAAPLTPPATPGAAPPLP